MHSGPDRRLGHPFTIYRLLLSGSVRFRNEPEPIPVVDTGGMSMLTTGPAPKAGYLRQGKEPASHISGILHIFQIVAAYPCLVHGHIQGREILPHCRVVSVLHDTCNCQFKVTH
jgi:hypothetical protein